MSFRPVDLGIPNSILNAFVQGSQIKQRREQLAQQGDLEQKRIDLEKQRVEDEHDFKQHQIDILSKGAEIDRLLNLQKIGAGVTQGEYLPGMQIQPSKSMPQDLPSFGEDQNLVKNPPAQIPKTITVSHPSINNGQPFEIENPEEYKRSRLEEQAKLAEVTEVPKRTTATTIADITSQRQAFLEYQKLVSQAVENDANRKNRVDIANINAASRLAAARARGASDKVSRLADTISTQFNNNPISKNYEVVRQAYNAALNPNASDYDILNAYGRASNPNSVLNNGEISVLQQLPSIGAKFGLTVDSIAGNKNFFDSATREKVKNSIGSLLKIHEGAYQNLRGQANTQMKTIGELPENWLNDYSKRQVGDVVKIGGKTRVIKAAHPDGSFDLEDE